MFATVLALTLTAFGDSITQAYCPPANCGASDAAHGYVSIVAAARGATVDNQGYQGTQLADAQQMDRIYSASFTSDEEFMLLTGFNDQHRWVTQPAGRQTYREALAAAVAWLAVDHSSKIRPASSGVQFSSGWSSGGAHGSHYTTTNGASVTFTVTGSTIYLVSERQNISTGVFLLTVDGEPIGTFACFGNPTTYNGRTYTPFLIRVTGLTPGSHTVTMTKTGGDYVYFTWAGTPTPGRPTFVGNCLRLNAAGYTALSTSALDVALYNRDIAMVVETLASDGLPVALVDASAAYDPNIDAGNDNIHPNDNGHAKIAAAFLAVMNAQRPNPTHRRSVVVGPW